MKTAIVHDWLVTCGGAEHVLEQILALFPEADLFALCDFLPAEQRHFLGGRKVTTSFIQKLPLARTKYRSYLPLMPLAVEQFDLSGYDLVISSSHAVAKGVITGPDQIHISYFNGIMTYAWNMYHHYLNKAGLHKGLKGLLARLFLHYIRNWDVASAHRVDHFIANSEYMARQIHKLYGRAARIIHPPVNLEQTRFSEIKEDYYVTVARMVPIKRIDLIVSAFSRMPEKKLIVIGDGPELFRIKKLAGDNIKFLGYQAPPVVMHYLSRARAFVFASAEPFGIATVEAQACGTPVIAYGRGGSLETVIENKTGVFFGAQEIGDLIEAVNRFERMKDGLDPAEIREAAFRFSIERFHREFRDQVYRCIREHARSECEYAEATSERREPVKVETYAE
jgi:O-antigen biosynthesis alpha-1,3-mannosyltransferase